MASEWLTDEVEVPQSLLDALTGDRLVIFAGAGVSMPAPTKMPGFVDLAKSVGVNAGYPHTLDDPAKIDTFLGNVHDYSGANVHRMAEEVLATDGKRGNRLHRALTRLSSAASLRIVTTNYDPFLSRSLKGLGSRCREYVAPALPLGESFNGLVYLHGKLPLAEGDTMILTDRDFGEAYVTNGWASRFLTRMFGSYNVLFVGYSGTDTVMRYLTRSLPPTGREHFALVPANELDKWQGLNITTVPFPPQRNYAALPKALEAWVLRSGLTQMDHVARVEEVVAKGLPVSAFDESFLSSVFARVETLQHFLRVAEPNEWLRWCENRGDLDVLWSKSLSRDSAEAYAWAQWACRSVSGTDPLLLFRAIHRHGGEMSDSLWWSTWRSLVTDYPPAGIAGRYISTLLIHAQPSRRLELSLLLGEAASSDRVGAMRLLEWALTPVARFKRDMWSLADDHDFGMHYELNGDPHYVGRALEKLQPLSVDEANSFLLNCLGFFVTVSRSARHFYGHPSDPISASRVSIAPHWTDKNGNQFRLLVDIARDSLKGLAGQGLDGMSSTLLLMARSESQMIRRLALDVLATSGDGDPDAVLSILIAEKLLFVPELKREVVRALVRTYSNASEDVKEKLLAQLLNKHGHATPDPSVKQRYEMLARLVELNPLHNATADVMLKFQEENPEYARRKNAGTDTYPTDIPKRSASPLSGHLRGLSPHAMLAEIQAREGHYSEDWLSGLASAAESTEWTDGLLTVLTDNGVWTEELWDVLCQSVYGGPARSDVSQLLRAVAAHPFRSRYIYAVSDALNRAWASNEALNVYEVHKQLAQIFELWRSVADASNSDESDESDVCDRALFSSRGRLAYCYLLGVGVLERLAPKAVVFQGPVRATFELMLGEEKDFETLVVLAGSTGWFFGEDVEWAKAKLLPLFDWDESVETAVPMWAGLLGRGSWSSRTVEHLSESIRLGYHMVRRHLPGSVNAFLDHHSFLYTSGLLPNEDASWADPLTVAASVEERTEWIDSVSRRYRDSPLSPETWRRLLMYWSRRTRQTPNALHEQEVNALIRWLVLPGAVLPDALPVLLASPIPRGPDASTRIDFDYNELPLDLYPQESGKVLARVLRGCDTGTWVSQDIGAACQKITELGAPQEALLVANELIRIGVPESVEWARSIRADPSEEP